METTSNWTVGAGGVIYRSDTARSLNPNASQSELQPEIHRRRRSVTPIHNGCERTEHGREEWRSSSREFRWMQKVLAAWQRTRLWETESARALKHILMEYFRRCPASADRHRARQDTRTGTDHWAKAKTNRAVAPIMATALLQYCTLWVLIPFLCYCCRIFWSVNLLRTYTYINIYIYIFRSIHHLYFCAIYLPHGRGCREKNAFLITKERKKEL